MSAFSTLYITRNKARELYLQKALGVITDQELEEFLDGYLRDKLYNAIIVDDTSEPNDDNVVD